MEDEQQRRKRMRRTTLDELEEGRVFPETNIDQNDQSCCSEEDFLCSSDDDEFSYGDIQSGLDEFSEFDCDYDYLEQDVEEDEIDPDELSYEELVALGEMVGVENTGLTEAEIDRHLHPLTSYASSILLIDRCVICQVEYQEGEKLVTLQQCHHLYHRDCIAKWLQIKKTCPICNNELQISSNNLI